MIRKLFFAPLRLLLLGTVLAAIAAAEEPEAPAECLVCAARHERARFPVEYKGMTFHLCSPECREAFHGAEERGELDGITAKVEPRAALFQEDSSPKRPLSKTYLALGLYIVAGLICGGIAAYQALQKGLGGASAFALGMLLNVLGLAIVLMKQEQEAMFSSRGFSKIPTTRDEVRCPSCGRGNHPSSTSCSGCAAALTPSTPSEVDLIRPEETKED